MLRPGVLLVTARPDRLRRAVGEGIGTSLLVTAVIGSGILGARMFPGQAGLVLLVNTIATGAALAALILAFGPLSGAHLNPVVTLADALEGGIVWTDVPAYLGAQFGGAVFGVVVAHGMFSEPAWLAASTHTRSGAAQFFSEVVATFGLLAVIWGCARSRSEEVPFAVAAYITAAYWFTASTSFANPAVTVARAFTATFSGIRPSDVPGFVIAQIIGGASATLLFRWLMPASRQNASRVVASRSGQ